LGRKKKSDIKKKHRRMMQSRRDNEHRTQASKDMAEALAHLTEPAHSEPKHHCAMVGIIGSPEKPVMSDIGPIDSFKQVYSKR
jgi:hypothetical protein